MLDATLSPQRASVGGTVSKEGLLYQENSEKMP